jgi:hypothetical protein
MNNQDNRVLLRELYEYMHGKGSRSEHNTNSLLGLMMPLDRYLGGKSFREINKKEQILEFLDHRYLAKEGKWSKREHDPQGKCIWACSKPSSYG